MMIEPADSDADIEWDVELERRKAEILSGTAQGRPAEDVFADIEKRCQKDLE